jgi:hypothetical protein
VLFRILALLTVVGVLAGGGWAVKNNVGGVRDRAMEQVTSLLDGLLGVKKPADKQKQAPPRVAVVKAPSKPVVAEKPVAAPPPFVDRSPTPSALERVKPEDRQRLEDLIAQKSQPSRSVAARDVGAKRHVQ